jgi:hypothetical protein
MQAHGITYEYVTYKATIAQLCLQQCKYNQAGNGFYQYFDIGYTLWLMSKDTCHTCTFILKLFQYHPNKTHQKTVTSAK